MKVFTNEGADVSGGLELVVGEKVFTLSVKSIASHFSLHLAGGIVYAVYKFFYYLTDTEFAS